MKIEKKNNTLSERFLKYRKSILNKTILMGSPSQKKKNDVSIPEIIYPGEIDIQEELDNLRGYSK